jgi:hypothetical protein
MFNNIIDLYKDKIINEKITILICSNITKESIYYLNLFREYFKDYLDKNLDYEKKIILNNGTLIKAVGTTIDGICGFNSDLIFLNENVKNQDIKNALLMSLKGNGEIIII